MERFLKANPGLQSRFDKILKFEDYSSSQLLDISISMFNEKELSISKDAKVVLLDYLETLRRKKDKYFGNARKVRKIVTEITENQNIRIASLSKEDREKINVNKIIFDDTQKVITEEKTIFDKKSIGFKAQGSR